MSSDQHSRPSLGIIGFGAFGRLMAQHLSAYFDIYAYDPAPQPETDGVTFATLATAAACGIVVLATPVGQFEAVIAAIAPHLKAGTLVLDVGSVKVVPAEIMLRCLPPDVDIIATHPLFGPQSARDGLAGLKIALCPLRGTATPEAHDREAAMVQGLTHLIAKVLVRMEPLPSRMTTRSFDLLLQAVEMVRHDAPEVFEAIERANPYARQVRRQFFDLAAGLDAALEDRR